MVSCALVRAPVHTIGDGNPSVLTVLSPLCLLGGNSNGEHLLAGSVSSQSVNLTGSWLGTDHKPVSHRHKQGNLNTDVPLFSQLWQRVCRYRVLLSSGRSWGLSTIIDLQHVFPNIARFFCMVDATLTAFVCGPHISFGSWNGMRHINIPSLIWKALQNALFKP